MSQEDNCSYVSTSIKAIYRKYENQELCNLCKTKLQLKFIRSIYLHNQYQKVGHPWTLLNFYSKFLKSYLEQIIFNKLLMVFYERDLFFPTDQPAYR